MSTQLSKHIYRPSSVIRAARTIAAEIENLSKKTDGMLVCAIDGRCASGKSTLGKLLQSLLPGSALIHLDDYFLRPEQRSKERLQKPGENVDYERLIEEVLLPLTHNQNALLRRYNCSTQTLESGRPLSKPSVLILEGSYSLNNAILPFSSFRIFTVCSPKTQKERLLHREGKERLRNFEQKWIPLEEFYFQSLAVENRADLIVDLDCPME